MFNSQKVFAKVGSFPKCVAEYRGDTPPEKWKVGGKVEIRSDHDPRIHKWTTCHIWKIDRWCGEAIYFFEL